MPKKCLSAGCLKPNYQLGPRCTGEMSRVKLQEAGLFVGHAFLIDSVRMRRKTIRRRRPT